MQIHKSVIKRARQDQKKRARRDSLKAKLKSSLKKFRRAPSKTELPKIVGLVHRMAQKGVIHKKTAFRYQSRLTLLTNKKVTA
jgi:small subunit ribosomal protein S20